MKKSILRQIIMLSRWMFYGSILNAIVVTTLLASELNAQNVKSVKECKILMDTKATNVEALFAEIESKSVYSFSFNKKEINTNQIIIVKKRKGTVAELLLEVSKQSDLKFKQVNNSIHVKARIRGNSLESDLEIVFQLLAISGKVIDSETGEGIVGVNIIEKGTSNGTITDLKGDYSVSITEGATMVFSFVGYTSEEIIVSTQSVIEVALAPDITSLSEVIVIGYGTQQKKEVISAVSKISSKDFNTGNIQSPVQLIQGKVAGLSISRPGSNPGGGFSIRMRGLSSLGANTEPLIVVDGVIGFSLENIDPNDIESFNVLKDASVAAIYGTRGSAGVILITTKTGKPGEVKVNYNGQVNVETPYRSPDVLSASEWRTLSNELGLGTDFGADTDWFDEITDPAVTQIHNLSLSSGSESTTYRASINYRDVPGVALNSGLDRINANVVITQNAINDKLKLSLNVTTSCQKSFDAANTDVANDDSGLSTAFLYATIYNPTAPVRSNDPQYDQYGGFIQQVLFDNRNPVAILEQNVNPTWL